jgi:hypothetical protein
MLAASHGRLPFPIGTNGAAVRRRAAPSSLYTRRRGLRCPRELPRSVRRRAGSRAQSVACAALLAATLAAPLVCPLLARSGYVPPPAAAASRRRHAAAANSQRSMGASRRKRDPFSFCYTWRPLLNSAICRG